MATKSETKWAITRHVYEISPRSLHLTEGLEGQAIGWGQSNSTTTDPCCYGNDICRIWSKIFSNGSSNV